MLIQSEPPLHITYCTNIHAGECLSDIRDVLERHVLKVKERLCLDRPFGLGLRVSRRACDELLEPGVLCAFCEWMDRHQLYVFTINGFPYGAFHGPRVKERVYAPDWRDPARKEYTIHLARVLAALLPDGVSGSISTVPGSFRAWIRNQSDVAAMTAHLVACAEALAHIHEQTGRLITVALEPEPACWLETIPEAIRFFLEALPDWTRPYLGLCLDTCHLAVQFEPPLDAIHNVQQAGIRIAKIQISAAVQTSSPHMLEQLRDNVYLHQMRIRRRDGSEVTCMDIPAARTCMTSQDVARVHFHVPLYCTGGDEWQSTVADLAPDFFQALRSGATQHVEVETYTFDQVPAHWKVAEVDEHIARELLWLKERLETRPASAEGAPSHA